LHLPIKRAVWVGKSLVVWATAVHSVVVCNRGGVGVGVLRRQLVVDIVVRLAAVVQLYVARLHPIAVVPVVEERVRAEVIRAVQIPTEMMRIYEVMRICEVMRTDEVMHLVLWVEVGCVVLVYSVSVHCISA
jgi:hypothetical protein